MESKELKRQMAQTAVERLMAEHQVPARQLLAAVQKIENMTREHGSDIKEWHSILGDFKKILSEHGRQIKSYDSQIQSWDAQVKRISSITHLKGDPGESVSLDAVIQALKPHLPKAQELNKQEIIAGLLPFLPKLEEVEPNSIDEEAMYARFVERIRKEQPIDISEIKNAKTFMFNKNKYKIEELMRGAGGTSSGSTSNILTQYSLAATQDGSDALVALSQLSHFATLVGVIVAYRNQIPQTNGVTCTISGTQVRFINADAGEVFSITYTYA